VTLHGSKLLPGYISTDQVRGGLIESGHISQWAKIFTIVAPFQSIYMPKMEGVYSVYFKYCILRLLGLCYLMTVRYGPLDLILVRKLQELQARAEMNINA